MKRYDNLPHSVTITCWSCSTKVAVAGRKHDTVKWYSERHNQWVLIWAAGMATCSEAQWTWRSHVASPPGCSCQRDDAPFYTTESTCIRASDRHRACADSKTVNTCKIKHLQNICKNFLVFYFTPNRGLIFTVHLGAWLNEGNASFAHSRCRRKPWQRIELIIAEKTAEVSK